MIIILSGPIHGGKTTLLQRLAFNWRDRGLPVRGFLSLSLWEARGRRGYDLLDLRDGGRLPFLRTRGHTTWERVGPFYVIPETLERARAIILGTVPRELLIVDEVGPLELGGGGLWTALEQALAEPSPRTILVIREGLLEDFLGLLAPHRPLKIDIREKNAESRLEDHFIGSEVSSP